ncbi:MAG: hypothetical protein COS92_06270 [Desulfobacterales bacterium CG07_land_8_20_14_0_80_52_14]|nr:MAG: hypothetical protein COX20_04885 [Desulfobacterales bacterium CG23_combo_of_CG06-09_8_20_14_all_52_9]PIU49550.1 MAG: hypothetical protein COS92_06270 [Desulfobacterales bacterium CG07_land_8_20_14_0_80_52_14]
MRKSAQLMGLCYRKVRRISGRSRQGRVGRLIHRNSKDAPQNRLDPTLEGWILELYGRIPVAFNNFHFMEIIPVKWKSGMR